MLNIGTDLMLLTVSPVEYLPLNEDCVFKAAHLNVSPSAQMAITMRVVFIQRLWLE